MAVKAIPDQYHSVQPYLTVKGAAAFIDFMKSAFGAEETFRMGGPGGTIGHAEVRIGDSVIMLSDDTPDFPPQPATLMLYVEDCDGTYKRALSAGATSEREPADQFYGDRSAGVIDAFGIRWWVHTHIEDVPPEEMEKRAAAATAGA
jgi:PhnB protein